MSIFGSSSTTVKQQTKPWRPQRQHLTGIFDQAQNLSQQPMQFFPGDTVAGFTPAQTQGQNMLTGFAGGPGQGFARSGMGANQFLMSPDILSPESNPHLAGFARAMNQPLIQDFQEHTLPSIRHGAQAAGQGVGGTRQGVAEGIAAGRLGESIARQNLGLFSGAYGQGLDAMSRGLSLAPSTMGMGMMPGQAMSDVGAQQQFQRQREIDADIARHQFDQMEPWQRLQLYQSAVGPPIMGESVQQIPAQSPLAGMAGGGLTGAGLAAMTGGATLPWTLGGAGAGLLMS